MRKTFDERFLNNINKTDSCWIWTGNINKISGYGRMTFNYKTEYAHRLSYKLWNGPIPNDKPFVCHTCDNPPCVNPKHLYAGTPQDNVNDRTERKRHPFRSTNTHCPHGHEFNEQNNYTYKGKRRCNVCNKLYQRELNKKKKLQKQ